jgi:hypothetical protein
MLNRATMQLAVMQQLSDFVRWKARVSYGHRWWIAESVFSAIKRMFGEHVMARIIRRT